MRRVGPKPVMKSFLLAKEGHTLGSEFSRTQNEEHSTTSQESVSTREKPAAQRSLVLLRLRFQESPSNAPEWSGGSLRKAGHKLPPCSSQKLRAAFCSALWSVRVPPKRGKAQRKQSRERNQQSPLRSPCQPWVLGDTGHGTIILVLSASIPASMKTK